MPYRLSFSLLVVVAVLQSPADEPAPPPQPKEALAWFNDVVGEWRGVGQVRRGSTRGSWRETGTFRWDFTEDEPAILYNVDDGKHLASLRITYDGAKRSYRVEAKPPEGEPVAYVGAIDRKKNVFTAETAPGKDGHVERIVVTRLNPKRTLVRFERRLGGREFATRIGEVGYTREGTRLAKVGETGPVCIVTGGLGTTLVSYKGESYYVCCEGCKQAFDDDPAGIVAAYKAKLAADDE